ncbi:MAG: AAA family ATPase [Pyrinomonadaceae bacterium]
MHNPYITEIAIPRPDNLGGNTWNFSGLTNLVAFFGKNGSGKSQLFRAWRDTNPESIHYVIPERTGEFDYQPSQITNQQSAAGRRETGSRNFTVEYRRTIVARIQAYLAARGNYRGDSLPTSPEELERLINQILPDFYISLRHTNPPYVLTRASDDVPIGSVDELSTGEAQVIILALDILTIAAIWEVQEQEVRIMLLDEPDAHIHPDLQVRFADFLVQVAERFKLQVILATHSTTLLSAIGQFGKDQSSVVYMDRTKDTFQAQPFSLILQELAGCLGGHALMGPLFGVPLLLVEGDDDYRIWSQVPRHHVISLAAIPCGGDEIKKYQKSLEQIFTALREGNAGVAGYALLDGDKGKPAADEHTPQMHVQYVQLNCLESENLFLTDEVLATLGTNWVDAKAKVLAEAAQYGEKEAQLLTIADWDRQEADIKDVIEQLSLIIDPKKVHWTLRVAKTIGSQQPTGQLADFLGAEMMETFWH